MNNNPDCHPETPESGQEWARLVRCQSSRTLSQDEQQNAATFDSEALHLLLKSAEYSESLVRMAWNAYYAAKYNDTRRALYNLNEARIYTQCVQKKLELLPPTEDSPRK